MLTTVQTSPEISTFRELENLIRSQGVATVKARLDSSGLFEAKLSRLESPTPSRGSGKTLGAALTAAFASLARENTR